VGAQADVVVEIRLRDVGKAELNENRVVVFLQKVLNWRDPDGEHTVAGRVRREEHMRHLVQMGTAKTEPNVRVFLKTKNLRFTRENKNK